MLGPSRSKHMQLWEALGRGVSWLPAFNLTLTDGADPERVRSGAKSSASAGSLECMCRNVEVLYDCVMLAQSAYVGLSELQPHCQCQVGWLPPGEAFAREAR